MPEGRDGSPRRHSGVTMPGCLCPTTSAVAVGDNDDGGRRQLHGADSASW